MTENLDKQNSPKEEVQLNNQEDLQSGKVEKIKKIVGFSMITIVMVATLVFLVNWWFFNLTHAETDNAQIDGHTYYISSKIPGKVAKVLVEDFQYVKFVF